jgi:DNA replication protein DnaC
MELTSLLGKLRMDHLEAQLDAVCEQAAQHQVDYKTFLSQALSTEWQGRYQKGIEARLRQARFPWVKSLEQFDFDLMTRLTRAVHENRLDRSLQQLIYPKVLIIDEIGYLPLSQLEASLFFRLVVRRYERASLIVTSNKSFLDWGETFNDPVLATAILDRLLHYSTTLNIKGESYRLKEKRRAGLLNRPNLVVNGEMDAVVEPEK